MEIDRLVLKSLSQELSDEERQTLYSWLEESEDHKHAYASIRDVQALRMAAHLGNVRTRDYRGRYLLSVAACLVLSLAVWSLYIFSRQDEPLLLTSAQMPKEVVLIASDQVYRIATDSVGTDIVEQQELLRTMNVGDTKSNRLIVPQGKIFSIKLSDGTVVWLNSMSELRFPSKFGNGERLVELSGEAFFEVARDSNSPFIVKTGNSRIRVLGTCFNVSVYKDYGQEMVSLVEGSVEATVCKQVVKLVPGEQLAWLPRTGQVSKGNFNPEEVMAWMNGDFFFEDQPLAYVLKAFERWYGVEFEYAAEALKDIHVYIRIGKEKALEDLFQALETTLKISFRQEGGKVWVESKNY